MVWFHGARDFRYLSEIVDVLHPPVTVMVFDLSNMHNVKYPKTFQKNLQCVYLYTMFACGSFFLLAAT